MIVGAGNKLQCAATERHVTALPHLSKKKVHRSSHFLVSQRSLFLRPALSHDSLIQLQIHRRSFTLQHKTQEYLEQDGPSSRYQETATMQAMPDSRQQSFEEIYGPPENFLEIEVSSPFF